MAYPIQNVVNDSSIDEATKNFAPSPADGADGFGMTESGVGQPFYPLRQLYRNCCASESAHTVMVPRCLSRLSERSQSHRRAQSDWFGALGPPKRKLKRFRRKQPPSLDYPCIVPVYEVVSSMASR
jgi:hypothetical protein